MTATAPVTDMSVALADGAEYVAYVIGDELIVVARREVWHRAARSAWKAGLRRSCDRGSHPTKGVVIPVGALLTHLSAALDEAREAA